jgi:hypothetical protein
MTDTALTPEQIDEKREQKLRERRYFTVSFSDKKLPEGKAYRCWECGEIVQTVFNEPKEQAEIIIPAEDVGEGKLTGSLCRKDNILYLFVWYGS